MKLITIIVTIIVNLTPTDATAHWNGGETHGHFVQKVEAIPEVHSVYNRSRGCFRVTPSNIRISPMAALHSYDGPTGHLYISSSPYQAEIYLNGIYYTTTPNSFYFPVGRVFIAVKKPGYKSRYISTEISTQQPRDFSLNLERDNKTSRGPVLKE